MILYYTVTSPLTEVQFTRHHRKARNRPKEILLKGEGQVTPGRGYSPNILVGGEGGWPEPSRSTVTVEWFEKFSRIFFNFVVCNPYQSSPSLTILVPLWFIIISLVFFYLCKVLFSGFLQFNSNFVDAKNNSKYSD